MLSIAPMSGITKIPSSTGSTGLDSSRMVCSSVSRADRCAQLVERAVARVERVLKLGCAVGDALLEILEILLEPRGHGVEASRQDADLILLANLGLLVQIAAGDARRNLWSAEIGLARRVATSSPISRASTQAPSVSTLMRCAASAPASASEVLHLGQERALISGTQRQTPITGTGGSR